MQVNLRFVQNNTDRKFGQQYASNGINNFENQCTHLKQTGDSQFKNLFKIITILLLFTGFFSYRLLFQKVTKKNGVIDHIHEQTFGLNRWLNLNASVPFIGLGQIIMDICICASTLYWTLFLKNFRYPVVMAMFQYGRSLMLRIITMPYASYVLWFNPGFPSFSVFYEHTSDYFFSGHTGTLVILILESRKLDLPIWVKGYLYLGTIYIIFMLLIGRVHYTIDVFGGLIYSTYIYDLVDKNLSFFDQIMNAPYNLVDKVRQKVKQKLKQNQQQGTSLYEIEH